MGKNSLYDNKLVFRDAGVVFTLEGNIFSMTTDYDFNKPESLYAKQIINFLHEVHFNTRATSKSNRDKNLIKNYFNKRAIIASGLKTVFLSENLKEL